MGNFLKAWIIIGRNTITLALSLVVILYTYAMHGQHIYANYIIVVMDVKYSMAIRTYPIVTGNYKFTPNKGHIRIILPIFPI